MSEAYFTRASHPDKLTLTFGRRLTNLATTKHTLVRASSTYEVQRLMTTPTQHLAKLMCSESKQALHL
jgi:hypothetical protein